MPSNDPDVNQPAPARVANHFPDRIRNIASLRTYACQPLIQFLRVIVLGFLRYVFFGIHVVQPPYQSRGAKTGHPNKEIIKKLFTIFLRTSPDESRRAPLSSAKTHAST